MAYYISKSQFFFDKNYCYTALYCFPIKNLVFVLFPWLELCKALLSSVNRQSFLFLGRKNQEFYPRLPTLRPLRLFLKREVAVARLLSFAVRSHAASV